MMNAESSTHTPEGKLDAFEGLRGLASLAVLLSHLIIAFWPVLYNPGHPLMANYPGWAQALTEGPTRVMIDGQHAVVGFFLLSGFVLSLGYFRRPTTEVLSSAAARRYLRLMLPASVSVILGYYAMKWGWMHNQRAAAHMTQLLGMPHTWLRIFYNFDPDMLSPACEAGWYTFFVGRCYYNANLWTMSVELTGSFLVYAFLALFGNLRWRVIFYIAVAVVMTFSARFFMLHFLIGVAVADVYVARERGGWRFRIPALVGLALAGLAIYIVSQKAILENYTILETKVAKSLVAESISGVILLVTTAFCPALQWVFSRRPFVLLGKLSFMLYITHLIVICSLGCYLYLKLQGEQGMSHHTAALWSSGATIAVSFGISCLMYLAVDRPSVTLGSLLYKKWFRHQAAMPTASAERPRLRLVKAA